MLGVGKIRLVESEAEKNFVLLLDVIERLNGPNAICFPLRMAAHLVEQAAFEAARSQSADTISDLIGLAAKIQHLMREFEPPQPSWQ